MAEPARLQVVVRLDLERLAMCVKALEERTGLIVSEVAAAFEYNGSRFNTVRP